MVSRAPLLVSDSGKVYFLILAYWVMENVSPRRSSLDYTYILGNFMLQSETLAYIVIDAQTVWGLLVLVEIGMDVDID